MTGNADLGDGGFEALLEAAPDGILVGLGVDALVPDRFRTGHRGRREGYLADPHPRPMGVELELYGRRRDGVEFPVEISLSSLRTAHGLRVITIVRDVSERRALKAESEALRQRSLQAVSDATLRNLAPDAHLRAVLGPVSEALAADVVAISIGEAGERPCVRAALGLPPEIVGSELLDADRTATVHRGAGELVDARWRDALPDTLISAPLVLGEQAIGVVLAGRRRGPLLGAHDAAVLERLAERIGLAVGQRRLYEAAQSGETRLREILGDVDGIVWEADDLMCRHYSFVSEGAESMLGYPTEAWTERDFWIGVVDAVDRDAVLARTRRPATTVVSTSWSTACVPPTDGRAGCATACG